MGLSGRRLTITLAGVLAVLLVLGASAAFAVGRAQRLAGQPSGPGGGASSGSAGGSTTIDRGGPGPSATPDQPGISRPSEFPDTQTAVSPTPQPGESSAASNDQPVPVTLSASAEAAPHAQEVRDLISRYFTAINRHDYDAWLSTVSTSQAKRSRDNWVNDYQTTHDSNVYISDIYPGDPLTVRMQFTSHQSVELAPSALPEECVRWDVTYTIMDEGTGLRVGTSAKSPSMARCT